MAGSGGSDERTRYALVNRPSREGKFRHVARGEYTFVEWLWSWVSSNSVVHYSLSSGSDPGELPLPATSGGSRAVVTRRQEGIFDWALGWLGIPTVVRRCLPGVATGTKSYIKYSRLAAKKTSQPHTASPDGVTTATDQGPPIMPSDDDSDDEEFLDAEEWVEPPPKIVVV
eukprot:comp17089_c0_seq1/m.15842 comp17089_c0_seq1/g.15842  ORF comp17089_c0_seq1/g.15842 comp17089_c0_seq1/m.15842 type:complete len:171 (-) comp17089_c0_seq1:108-620(-)